MEKLADYFTGLLAKLKITRKKVCVLSILVFTVAYILNLGAHAYISIPNRNLDLELPSFLTFELTFREPVKVLDYRVTRIGAPHPPDSNTNEIQAQPIFVNQSISTLSIRNPNTAPAPGLSFQVAIRTESEVSEITGVSLDAKSLTLKEFLHGNLRNSKATHVRFRYIRKDLANFIYRSNDFLSNCILTIMVAGISLLALKVAQLEFQAYVYPKRFLKKAFPEVFDSPDANNSDILRETFDRCAANWLVWDTRFQQLQALGPALGFILTVSSLIEALHPALLSSNDIEGFLSGIHVALISTFLGLAMRLVALEGARVNDRLGELFRVALTPVPVVDKVTQKSIEGVLQQAGTAQLAVIVPEKAVGASE